MARRDYICCKSCGCKLVYDGYDNIRCDLEAQYGTMDLICPDCLKELETKLAARNPLSDEEVNLLVHNADEGDWNDMGYQKCWRRGYVEGIRAAEYEHGIGEQE